MHTIVQTSFITPQGKIKSRLKLIFVPVVRNEMEDGYVECTQEFKCPSLLRKVKLKAVLS